MKTKILILGATGRLGSCIYEYYFNNAHFEVTGFNRKKNFEIDITDTEKLKNYLNLINPDIIINAIALANVDECEENPLLALKLNSELLTNITDWMDHNEKTYMVHISTDHIYDHHTSSKENEINIKNMYAFSKYLGDKFALKSNTSILRTNFFGIFKNKNSLCNWAIDSIKRNKQIFCYDNIFFSPLHINTLVDFIDFFVKHKILGIYNIGSLEGSSKHNFILEMIKILGLRTDLITKCSYTFEKNKIDRPKNMIMNLDKISKIYNKDLPILKNEILKLKVL